VAQAQVLKLPGLQWHRNGSDDVAGNCNVAAFMSIDKHICINEEREIERERETKVYLYVNIIIELCRFVQNNFKI